MKGGLLSGIFHDGLVGCAGMVCGDAEIRPISVGTIMQNQLPVFPLWMRIYILLRVTGRLVLSSEG